MEAEHVPEKLDDSGKIVTNKLPYYKTAPAP